MKVKVGSEGIGLGGVLFVVFLVLKLTGHITWSWWWVTSPLWISIGLMVLMLVILFAFAYRATHWRRMKRKPDSER